MTTPLLYAADRERIIPSDYDELNVGAVKQHIRDEGLEDEPIALEEIRDYESATKRRVTLLSWLDAKITEAEPAEIVVTPTRTGYVAGRVFRSHDEMQTVEYNRRIRMAIDEGDLEVVDTL